MKREFWNKLRVLVTNKCNYRCPFCHNEGLPKAEALNMMKLSDFKMLIDILNGQNISELNFSGGEPFLNPEIVEMIKYACEQTTWDIGCATNLSLITDKQVSELKGTRVKFNIQFPFANADDFRVSTGNGDFETTKRKIHTVKAAGLELGLNSVVQSHNIQALEELLCFAMIQELPLKLLPQIGLVGSEQFKKDIYPILEYNAIKQKDKGTGAIKWIVESGGHRTSILYIDSPCFYHDINTCRNFGEIRIHPDMSLQTCIMDKTCIPIDLSHEKNQIISQFTNLWNNFKTC